MNTSKLIIGLNNLTKAGKIPWHEFYEGNEYHASTDLNGVHAEIELISFWTWRIISINGRITPIDAEYKSLMKKLFRLIIACAKKELPPRPTPEFIEKRYHKSHHEKTLEYHKIIEIITQAAD